MADLGQAVAQSRPQDGFRQAMLKTALDTTPQLTEDYYQVWRDKMTAILDLRGLLTSLEDEKRALFAEDDAELRLLLISKMDSSTHNNVVNPENRGSAKALWRAIKERFASSQAANRARIFNLFLYLEFQEEAVEDFVTEAKVLIKRMLEVGIDLPQDILAYLILFKFPDGLQLLKKQLMHSDKELSVEFICNHLIQHSNEHRAERREGASEAALATTWAQPRPRAPPNQGPPLNHQPSGRSYPRCSNGRHNPRLDHSHTQAECWHENPSAAPDWWRSGRRKGDKSNTNYFLSLISLWIDAGDPRSRLILDSGSSAHVFNDRSFFSSLALGDFDVIKTGKAGASMPVKGRGTVRLRWGERSLELRDCLFVPDLVVNLVSPGFLDEKGCVSTLR